MSGKQLHQLDKLYRELPTIECQGHCHTSCGPIGMTTAEMERIEKRVRGPIPRPRNRLDCPLLTPEGRCSVYHIRPLICRLWGLTEGMPCTFGCVPSRVLTDDEGAEFLRRAREISEGVIWLGDRDVLRAIAEGMSQ